MEAPTSVWVETRITNEGISISLLSESRDGAIVEDETWFTFSEMKEMAPSAPISLNLTDTTRDLLRQESAGGEEKFGRGHSYEDGSYEHDRDLDIDELLDTGTEPSMPQKGDVLMDQNPPPWGSDKVPITVTEVLENVKANEHTINEYNMTVADANPSYSRFDPVILGTYPDSDKEYAFPKSRLSK